MTQQLEIPQARTALSKQRLATLSPKKAKKKPDETAKFRITHCPLSGEPL